MKNIFIFLMFLSFKLFGCDANCLACHPNLEKNGKLDANHQILRSCTNCHVQEEGKEDHGACGVDCWQCHDITKVNKVPVKEHKVLPKCIKCHESIDKSLLQDTLVPNKPLQDLLLK